jgi:hypothetical protein
MSKEKLHAILQGVIDRSKEQKLERLSKLRGELHDLGYSVVTTKWLDTIYKNTAPEDMERWTWEASK